MCFQVCWRSLKTGTFKVIPLLSDRSWILDVYNALACMRICGNGLRYASAIDNNLGQYLLPHMNREASNIGKSINDSLQSAARLVPGVSEGITGTCLRKGAIDDILMNPQLDFKHAATVSGHEMSKLCSVFEYATVLTNLQYEASKVLGGWGDSINAGIIGETASLDVVYNEMEDIEQRRMCAFIKSVLHITPGSLYDEGQGLWLLSTIYVATILKDLREMIECNPKHVVISTFTNKAKEYGKWCLSQLYAMGDTIR